MNEECLELLINNLPRKYKLRRYKIYIENSTKSYKEMHYEYLKELDRIDKKKCININKKEFTISIDAYRKYIKTIEAEGIRSIINREDIANLAISINPTYINNIFSSSRCREYIRSLRVELEPSHFVDFLNIHIERFPEDETIRKEIVKYISRYRNGIIDISTLKAKNNIYFIQLKTYDISEEGKKKAGYIDIKCYRYIDKKLKIVFEETYKSIYLKPYIEGVSKGYINYNILQLKEMIEKNVMRNYVRELKI